MSRVFSLLKFCIEVCRNPQKAPELVEGWGAPLLIWVLAGIVFFWPIAFFMGSYGATGLVLLVPLAILGVPLMGIFWVYSWVVFFALARIFGKGMDGKGLFKLVGICLSPLFIGGLANILVAIMFFRSPLAPNFVVMVASLGYFVYCVTKALQAELKDGAYVVGLLYAIITLVLWFSVKLG